MESFSSPHAGRGDVKALDKADFTLQDGEIHALIGENGAGKSTLMHILSGYIAPTEENIFIDNTSVPVRFKSPRNALNAGIGMVRQHPSLVWDLSVWENCLLGAEMGFFVSPKKQRARVADMCARWGFDLPLDSMASELSVSGRQFSALVNLLLRGCRVLIFDEVTAVLTASESERLFALFRRLKERHFSVVIISHKLDEVLTVSDRITVLRKGRTVAELDAKDTDAESLAAFMFEQGAETRGVKSHVPSKKAAASGAPPVLSITKLSAAPPDSPFIRNVGIEASAGRIIGVAGVRDSGLGTLEGTLTGLVSPTAGSIKLNGIELTTPFKTRTFEPRPLCFRAAGLAYLNADRAKTCLALELPLWYSLVIHAHRRLIKHGVFLDKAALKQWALGIVVRAGIERQADDPASSFSGGQLQRLLLERELSETAVSSRADVPLLVLSEPGWGLDSRARGVMEEKIMSLASGDDASRGAVVLVFSTDIDELLRVCDEVLVLHGGEITARIMVKDPIEACKLAVTRAMV